MNQLNKILPVAIILCLCLGGCETLKESRGDLLEDTRKLINDGKSAFSNLSEKTFIIRGTTPR